MDNNNMVMVAIVVVVILLGTGIVPWDGIVLAINGTDEWPLGTGSGDVNITTTTTTTTITTSEEVSSESTLSVGTGYINSEGEWVFPTEDASTEAQSVFWAGTDELVIDVGISPALTVIHSDELAGLDSVEYVVTLTQIGAMVEGETSYTYASYGDFVVNTVFDLPADGGPLGTTAILSDVFGIILDTSGDLSAGAEFDVFLWEALENIGVNIGETYLEEGTFRISMNLVLALSAIVIDYSLIDGTTGVYETAADTVFTKEIKLDLEFVIPPAAVPTLEISWLPAIGSPSIDPDIPNLLPEGPSIPISITYKPRIANGVASHWEFYNGDYLMESGDWNGGDVSVSFDITPKVGMDLYCMLKVYATEGSPATYTVRYLVFDSQIPAQSVFPITGLGLTFSTYFPSSGGLSTTTVLFLCGGFTVLIFGGYWYKKNNVVSIKNRRRKRR
jgi:hypothetical protein